MLYVSATASAITNCGKRILALGGLLLFFGWGASPFACSADPVESITGTVVNRRGAAIEDALVFVSEFNPFAPRRQELRIVVDDKTIAQGIRLDIPLGIDVVFDGSKSPTALMLKEHSHRQYSTAFVVESELLRIRADGPFGFAVASPIVPRFSFSGRFLRPQGCVESGSDGGFSLPNREQRAGRMLVAYHPKFGVACVKASEFKDGQQLQIIADPGVDVLRQPGLREANETLQDALPATACQLPLRSVPFHKGTSDAIETLAVDPTGNRIYVGSLSGDISVRNLSKADLPPQFAPPFGKMNIVADIEFSPSFDQLAIADYYGALHIYSLANEFRKSSFEFQHKIRDLDFSDDGARLYVAGSSKGVIEVVNLNDNTRSSIKYDADSNSTAICVDSPRGNIVIGNEFGGVKIVSLGDGQVVQHIETPKICVHSVAVSPHGRLLAFGGGKNEATVWDLDDGEILSRTEIVGDIGDIEFLSNQSFVVVTHKGWLQVVDADQGVVVAGVKAHSGWATTIDFPQRSSTITTGGEDGKVHQWRWNPELPHEIRRAP